MRKGWWKPYVSAAIGGGIGLGTAAFSAATGNPLGVVGGLTAAREGAKKGYDLHESIRQKYNVPWMGDKKYRGKRSVPAMGKRSKSKKKKSSKRK